MSTRKRVESAPLCLRHDAARHLYALGYRITSDGRLSRPRYGIERISSQANNPRGPATEVVLLCSDGVPRMVLMPYAHLALLSFFGPEVLRPGVRVCFKDNNLHNLKKNNVGYFYHQPKAEPPEDPRAKAWREKGERERFVALRGRPELVAPQTLAALLYAIEHRMANLEAAAERLDTTVGIVLVLLNKARQDRRRQVSIGRTS